MVIGGLKRYCAEITPFTMQDHFEEIALMIPVEWKYDG